MIHKIYTIKARYGIKHKLEHIGRNKFRLDLDDNAGALIRCGGTNRDDLEFVDPHGGPFISKNMYLEEIKRYIVNISINKDGIIFKTSKHDISSK